MKQIWNLFIFTHYIFWYFVPQFFFLKTEKVLVTNNRKKYYWCIWITWIFQFKNDFFSYWTGYILNQIWNLLLFTLCAFRYFVPHFFFIRTRKVLVTNNRKKYYGLVLNLNYLNFWIKSVFFFLLRRVHFKPNLKFIHINSPYISLFRFSFFSF